NHRCAGFESFSLPEVRRENWAQTRWTSTEIRVLMAVGVGTLLCLVFTLRLVQFWIDNDPPTRIFTSLRALNLESGLSPLLPLFCVAMAGLLWAVSSLRRLRLVEGLQDPPNLLSPRPDETGRSSEPKGSHSSPSFLSFEVSVCGSLAGFES